MSSPRHVIFGVPAAAFVAAVTVAAFLMALTVVMWRWLGGLEQEWQQLDAEAAAGRIVDAIDGEFIRRSRAMSSAMDEVGISSEAAAILVRPPASFSGIYRIAENGRLIEPVALDEIPSVGQERALALSLELRDASRATAPTTARGPWKLAWVDGTLYATGLWESGDGDLIAAVFPVRRALAPAVRAAAGDSVRAEVLVEGRIAAGDGIAADRAIAEARLPFASASPPLLLRTAIEPGPREALFPVLSASLLLSGLALALAVGSLIAAWGRAAMRYATAQRRERLLHERSPLLYLVVDRDLVIRDANETVCESLRHDLDGLLGRSIAEIVYDSPDLIAGLRDVPDELSTFKADATWITRGGELRDVSVTAVAGELRPGVLSWQLFAQDLTSEKRAHKATAQSRHEVKFLSRIVESFSDGLLVVDEDGRAFYANPAALELIGLDAEALQGLHLSEILRQPEGTDAWSSIVEAIERGEPWEHEFGLVPDASDSLRVSVRSSGESPRRGGGRAVILRMHNLTNERRLMHALASSQRQYRTIFDQAPTGIIVLDETGTVRDYNEFHRTRLLPLLEGTASEGFRPLFEQPALVRAGGALAAERLYQGHAIVLEPVSVPTVSGETRVLSIKGVPEQDAQGTVRHAYLFVEDITDRHRRLLREAERADTLEGEKERAVTASRLKSQFLANISHELRTPLNAIIGFSQIIARRSGNALDERQRGNLSRIEDSGQKLLRLVDDLIDVTRIEAGQMDLRLEQVDLKTLFDDLKRDVEPLMARNSNEFRVVCPPAIGTLLTDPRRFRQVLLNLVANAAKFTEGGVVTLSAEPIAVAEGSDIDSILIGVEDSGIGIPEEQISRIFEEFYQVDSSATRAYGGTGLGLSIARELTQLLAGRMSVESEPGIGTTFLLRFPRQHPSAGTESSLGVSLRAK